MTANDVKEVVSNYARLARKFFDGAIVVSSPDMIAISDFIYRLAIENYKIRSVSKCQQNKDLPCNIGDTAYCVNGYGSQRYIEEFTVAEIRITKDEIWLTDTKGMEWLARVCHFNRESAARELNAQKKLIDIVNENFAKKDVDIQLTYVSDETPQSEEDRKAFENYMRRLKEQRELRKRDDKYSALAYSSYFYNRFMKTE